MECIAHCPGIVHYLDDSRIHFWRKLLDEGAIDPTILPEPSLPAITDLNQNGHFKHCMNYSFLG
jgi:hypothetical protein